MKTNWLIVVLLGAMLVFLSCEKQESLAPEMLEDESGFGSPGVLTKSTVTPVTGEFDFSHYTITNWGNSWVSGGILHIRDQIYESPVTGDLAGTVTVVLNANLHLSTFTGPLFGEFRFDGACNVCTPHAGKIVSQGSGGFQGMKLQGNTQQITPPPVNPTDPVIVEYSASILAH
jgi:hypothetical protein